MATRGSKAGTKAKASTAGATTVKSWSAGKVGSATLDGAPLGDKVKVRLLREAVRMYEANKRLGTHSTKTRGEVNFSERKPYKQKGTGNARRGDFNSPLLRKGGVIFGPRPRDYSYGMPRKALREALRSALAGKLRDGEVGTLKASFEKPSTKTAASALAALGCDGTACVVLPKHDLTQWKSFRNLRGCTVTRATDLNAHDVLAHRHVVFVDDAWDLVLQRLAGATS
ncbi:MAG TPA: 50S ribosomal protein L4 [Planctomycetota bacterium]|nr:50S ribosomal protein L4 [Planctomycetota bacterium]